MRNSEKPPDVSAVNLVVRHLKLESSHLANIEDAIAEISQLFGLDDVSFDTDSLVLNLAYDASRISIDGIEEILERRAIKVSHDWWTRFKEGYYRFVDQNVKDNATHEPWSCHRVPPGKEKNKK
ncbi:cation transporter [Kangiella shandongensis]|uniref:cation transporter n=1 Tax=Kangiella shandongensis TaxID=2763258 RepID=UPI001CBFB4A7|nr:cation transporter [Kangiella shandongensis]